MAHKHRLRKRPPYHQRLSEAIETSFGDETWDVKLGMWAIMTAISLIPVTVLAAATGAVWCVAKMIG